MLTETAAFTASDGGRSSDLAQQTPRVRRQRLEAGSFKELHGAQIHESFGDKCASAIAVDSSLRWSVGAGAELPARGYSDEGSGEGHLRRFPTATGCGRVEKQSGRICRGCCSMHVVLVFDSGDDGRAYKVDHGGRFNL
nr:hypothetical protein Iba_chr15bCG3030 [Ipomoea batatas]